MDVSVVIPVFNEQENLRPLLEEVEQALAPLCRPFEVIAVDDASTDGSRALLRQLAAAKPFLKIIRFRRNCGQSAAFDAGFRHASGRVVVTLDGDRQNDPADIPALLAKIDQGYDFVTGWRRERKDRLLSRRLPSALANALIRAVTRTRVHDLGCSLKAYRKDIVSGLRVYGETHRFLAVLAESEGARVAELPVRHRPRVAGESKYGLGRAAKVLLDLLTVWFLRNYQTKPIYLFGGVGALMLYEKLAMGVWVHRNPLFQVSVMLILIGMQFVGLGLLAEILIRTYFESQGKTSYPIEELVGFEGK
jgi:glycosyltransferase involved in cell wall biosynthesis